MSNLNGTLTPVVVFVVRGVGGLVSCVRASDCSTKSFMVDEDPSVRDSAFEQGKGDTPLTPGVP